jgi:hypothetical protein
MSLIYRGVLLLVGVLVLGTGYYLLGPLVDSALTQAPAPAPPAALAATAEPVLDLRPQPLDKIPVGTVIGDGPPSGWSHLVLFATPTLTAEDEREAPKIAADYARMFKFTVLANVASQRHGDRVSYWLEKTARGFATKVDGQETIVSSKNTMGASLGLFGSQILEENERILDQDVLQVVRSNTLSIFDAQAVLRQKDDHVRMVIRHAIVVDPDSGRLYTLVWLLTKDYETAEEAIQALPNSMHEARYLSVKRDKFNVLGIPTPEAFALRKIPQGKAVPYDEALKWAATLRTFSKDSAPKVEQILRDRAQKAAK